MDLFNINNIHFSTTNKLKLKHTEIASEQPQILKQMTSVIIRILANCKWNIIISNMLN